MANFLAKLERGGVTATVSAIRRGPTTSTMAIVAPSRPIKIALALVEAMSLFDRTTVERSSPEEDVGERNERNAGRWLRSTPALKRENTIVRHDDHTVKWKSRAIKSEVQESSYVSEPRSLEENLGRFQ
eukprot:CAMPEP_0171799520 /NCGR_PEP_ID=MMETSP0991-20121206/71159_1 /TAXON_ID=483369 /ORGANISM="non described non described, Strain CCMP2098" /LENGTH=128 /DNA_ID=CAMNT_0012410907 /DNA_START=265 /DNA_END=651 /DNA_ORIENTATION=-